MARVVFLGTPDFAVPTLHALRQTPDVEIVLVVTRPDRPAGRGRRLLPSPVKAQAEAFDLMVYQPARLRGEEVLARLRAADADLFVIAAYGQLLRPAVLELPRHGCLNVHPSLLPRHRGPAPIPAAILAGDSVTGVTIMLTDSGMDTGPILCQRALPLNGRETTAALTSLLADLGAQVLVETLPGWLVGKLRPEPQDERRATTSRLFTREDGQIDWSEAAVSLERQIRAFNPWPRAYTTWQGKRLLLLDARLATDDEMGSPDAVPGAVSGFAADGFIVSTGAGSVVALEVQLAGRRAMSAPVFARTVGLSGAVLGR